MYENAALLNTQAIELASKGDFHEAIACFKRAISIEKFNYLLWFNLGITYREAGDLIAAKEAVEKAYTLENKDDEVIETLALLWFHLGNEKKALKYCHEGLMLNNKNSRLWNTFGVVLFSCKQYEKAAESFEYAVTINPYYYDALYNLRDTYSELGNEVGVKMCNAQMKQIKNSGQK